MRRIEQARVTAAKGLVPVVICVKKAKMKDSWCLATNHAELTSAEIVNLYGRRFTIEETFRDVKDQRFGMGLKATSIRQPERRDRLLFVAALAHALLTFLGAAGERLGLDRMLKVNTSKTRQLSLYRQGLFWYEAMPNMREERFVALMTAYSEIIQQHAVMRRVFGVL
ncbi:MAG: transposase [Deltaproteobacteria bacterium]|nr:transposase [Deltaproteobacteria bacterium]